MARFFLAFLTLLFGLAVSGAPAQARGCARGEAEIGVLAVAVAGPRRTVSAIAAPAWAGHGEAEVAEAATEWTPRAAVPVLTVRQGVDRARE